MNNEKMNDGEDFPTEFLVDVYRAMRSREFIVRNDLVAGCVATGIRLSIPDCVS